MLCGGGQDSNGGQSREFGDDAGGSSSQKYFKLSQQHSPATLDFFALNDIFAYTILLHRASQLCPKATSVSLYVTSIAKLEAPRPDAVVELRPAVEAIVGVPGGAQNDVLLRAS